MLITRRLNPLLPLHERLFVTELEVKKTGDTFNSRITGNCKVMNRYVKAKRIQEKGAAC